MRYVLNVHIVTDILRIVNYPYLKLYQEVPYICFFFHRNQQAHSQPSSSMMLGNPLLAAKASIKMDRVTITSGNLDVQQALQCLLEVYFLFGVEYPKQMKHTLSFIEHYLFKIRNDNKRLSIPALKIYNQLSH